MKIAKICLILQKIQRFPENGSKLAKNSGIDVHFFFTKYKRIFTFSDILVRSISFWISHNLSEILHVQQWDLIAKRAKIGISNLGTSHKGLSSINNQRQIADNSCVMNYTYIFNFHIIKSASKKIKQIKNNQIKS